VKKTYGNYNHEFYETVFELLLRLKANYLWPAMWNNAFNEDDPQNARLADEYGIVMGTSHHEPMLRAQQEWKRHGTGPWDYAKNGDVLRAFWQEGVRRNKDYESIVSRSVCAAMATCRCRARRTRRCSKASWPTSARFWPRRSTRMSGLGSAGLGAL
jgi:hypothetical protein